MRGLQGPPQNFSKFTKIMFDFSKMIGYDILVSKKPQTPEEGLKMTYIPMTDNDKLNAYSIALSQILESNATDAEKAAAKASLDLIFGVNK